MPTCSPQGAICPRRDREVKRGTFLMSFRAKGWLWSDAPDNPAAPWVQCPWCAGDLPSPEDVFGRIRHRKHK